MQKTSHAKAQRRKGTTEGCRSDDACGKFRKVPPARLAHSALRSASLPAIFDATTFKFLSSGRSPSGKFTMTNSKRVTPKFFCLSVLGLCLSALAWQTTSVRSEEPKTGTEPKRTPANEPQYTSQGELKRPIGYETWVFVGSNIGLEYGDA